MKNLKTTVGVMLIAVCTVIACVGSYQSHRFSIQEKPASEVHDVPERFYEIEYVEIAPVNEEVCTPTEVPLIRTSEYVNLTFDEMELLERIAMAEAEGEDTIGKALIMRVVLNRSLRDGKSISEVIFAEHQFATYRMYIEPTDDCHEALAMIMDGWTEKEIEGDWDKFQRIYYFLPSGYSSYGDPMFQYGGHYFSGN